MFGAAPYLNANFAHLSRHVARDVVQAWMRSFSLENGPADRARNVSEGR
jgi:hypothetical protein